MSLGGAVYGKAWDRHGGFPRLAITLLFTLLPSLGAASSSNMVPDQSWSAFDRLIETSQKAMMADPAAALADARRAEHVARANKPSARVNDALATSLWLEAEALARINHVEDARAVVAAASKIAATDGKLSRLDGDLALTRGRIADARSDFGAALRNYQAAHAIFAKLGIARYQAIALICLGILYEKARDFDREVGYYRKASQAYAGDPGFSLSIVNNIGFALQQVGRYADAIDNYNQALKIATQLKSPLLEGRILTNLAMAYAKAHRLAEGRRAADRALATLGAKDEGGWAPFAWSVKADIDYQRGNINRAVTDLEKAFHGVNLAATIAPFRDAHEIAFRVYRAAGNFPLALAHLEAFKRLDDEGRSIAASANLALLDAQFDFANQQLEIAHLKSAELERDIKLRASRANTQRVVFVSIMLAGLIFLTWIAWRHALVSRHRNIVGQKNIELTRTLGERDQEIVRRTVVEAQLRDAMEAAQQANRAKSHFLANMSHELRTPLNAIIGFSELIVDRDAGREKTREFAASIAVGGRSLLSILTQVLDMARIEAGRVSLAENTVRLRDIIEGAVQFLDTDDAGRKRIRVGKENADLLVIADVLRLRQVLMNLLSNALKFSGGGMIDITVERDRAGVDIMVRDTGEGIPPDKMAVILEPFGQAESAYARKHGGAGLGLPIAKALVEMHGGRFTIAPGVTGGTEARIHLPEDRVVVAQRDLSMPIATSAA